MNMVHFVWRQETFCMVTMIETNNTGRDLASADIYVINIFFFLALMIWFSFGPTDVKGAYKKSGFDKKVYLSSPDKRGQQARKDMKFIASSVLDCIIRPTVAFWKWKLDDRKKKKTVPGIEHLFFKRGHYSKIWMLVAKVVDLFMVWRIESVIKNFFKNRDDKFSIEPAKVGYKLKFMGCVMKIQEGSKTIVKWKTNHVVLRKSSLGSSATPLTRIERIDGEIWINITGSDHSLSETGRSTPDIILGIKDTAEDWWDWRVSLKDANDMLWELERLNLSVCFSFPRSMECI